MVRDRAGITDTVTVTVSHADGSEEIAEIQGAAEVKGSVEVYVQVMNPGWRAVTRYGEVLETGEGALVAATKHAESLDVATVVETYPGALGGPVSDLEGDPE